MIVRTVDEITDTDQDPGHLAAAFGLCLQSLPDRPRDARRRRELPAGGYLIRHEALDDAIGFALVATIGPP